MATSQPTERTPLIEQRPPNIITPAPAPDSSHLFPFPSICILDLEREIYTDPDYPAIPGIIARKVDTLTTSPSTGATLKLVLTLRYLSGSYFELGKENWDWVDSRSAEEDATGLATRYWDELHRIAWSQAAVNEALWTPFALENGRSGEVTLIETILSGQLGFVPAMQLDDRVALSLLAAWKHGRPRPISNTPGSTNDGFMRRFESFATPRVLHLIDLAFYLVIVAILAHYIIALPVPPYSYPYPDPDQSRHLTFHFYCIAVYATGRVLWAPRPVVIHASFGLTLVALLTAALTVGQRRDELLPLVCFFIHIVQLLLPLSPSFPLLDPRSRSFPTASILQSLFSVVFFPAIQYFIPIIFVLLSTLVVSLNTGIFTTVNAVGGLVTFDLFIFLLWFSGILFSCLTGYMTLASSSLPPPTFHHPAVPASWNAYGQNVALSLRRNLCRSIITYSEPHFFPAPLNIIPAILVDFPLAILRSVGGKDVGPWLKGTVKPLLWRLLVLPLVFIFGTVWCWR